MPDTKKAADWLAKAKSELSAAQILQEHGGDNSIIAFLCQQAIEKALKGYILQEIQSLSEGHSLVFLCKKAVGIDESFLEFMKACAFVNQFYLETRYPADIPLSVSDAEAQECIDIAGAIINKVLLGSF